MFASACSNDDIAETVAVDPAIRYFIVTMDFSDNGIVYSGVLNQAVSENKLQDFTYQSWENGVLSTTNTDFCYEYAADEKTTVVVGDRPIVMNLHYDSQNRLSGVDSYDGVAVFGYTRNTYISDTAVHVEVLDATFDDPNAPVLQRYLAELDGEGNLVSAGVDTNLDGTFEYVNHFTIANGDIVYAEMNDGSTQSFAYSAIVDTGNMLRI